MDISLKQAGSRASLNKPRVMRLIPLKKALVTEKGEDPVGFKRKATFLPEVPSIRKVYILNYAFVAASSLTTPLAALINL